MSVISSKERTNGRGIRRRGEVVVVTGATAGIGRATAHRFARAGARVGLIARESTALDQVKDEIESMGGEAIGIAADVADAVALQNAADQFEQQLGRIDIWVNNAMVTVFGPIDRVTPEEFKRVTEVCYLGFVHGTKAALKHMRARNRGTIVQVGSALAYRGIPLQAAYCGAKHAIRGFTSSLHAELIHDGSAVHVTMVDLPAVNTPQFDWARTHMSKRPRPVPPVIQPQVAANAIYRAAHSRQREYWLGLSTLETILGNMLGPSFLDWYLARNAYDAQSSGHAVTQWRKDNLERSVPSLHRTRGSFSAEAKTNALLLPGPATRTVAALAILALAGGVGFATAKSLSGAGRPPQRIN